KILDGVVGQRRIERDVGGVGAGVRLKEGVAVGHRALDRRRQRTAAAGPRLDDDSLPGVLGDPLGNQALKRVRARTGVNGMTTVMAPFDRSSARAGGASDAAAIDAATMKRFVGPCPGMRRVFQAPAGASSGPARRAASRPRRAAQRRGACDYSLQYTRVQSF